MALPVAGCDLREGAQERPGGQCGGNNCLRSQLGRTLGNHRDGYRRVRSESVLAGLSAQPEGARPRGRKAGHLRRAQQPESSDTAGVLRQLAALPGLLHAQRAEPRQQGQTRWSA